MNTPAAETIKAGAPPESAPRQRRPKHRSVWHPELLDGTAACQGAADDASVEAVLALLPSLPVWPRGFREAPARGNAIVRGARTVLTWLLDQPGDGWQARWSASSAAHGLDWVEPLVGDEEKGRDRRRSELISGVAHLLLAGVVAPSYEFLAAYRAQVLYRRVQVVFCPQLFAQAEARATALGVTGRRLQEGLTVLAKVVLHTGRPLNLLAAEDLLAFRTWEKHHHGAPRYGVNLAWTLLHGIADLGGKEFLADAVRVGQQPSAALVEPYQLQNTAIRDVFVRYLDERRASIDYRTWCALVVELVGNFWADIEAHNPEIDTLRLPREVAAAWKKRLATITSKDGTSRPRQSYFSILITVRSFYLDIQEWAHEDPSWAQWAAPSPVRRTDTRGQVTARRRTAAVIHQRIRDRLPHLEALADAAERHRIEQAELLAAASAVAVSQRFEHAGCVYERTAAETYVSGRDRATAPPSVQAQNLGTGAVLNLSHAEDDAFWCWAIVETLRHTGLRVEELTELTHLALFTYRLPETGELVPMLQVVPSKSDRERLLLISPELASVLATIINRLRERNAGTVPLTARYDSHERTTGTPLPHLFQRQVAWRWTMLSDSTIRKLLASLLARMGICDAAGKPLRVTPHDFRRMFATEAAQGGLPIHIVARLLGHANINTTQAYTAVFDEELVRAYQGFLARRRAVRPPAEHRKASDAEWSEFQQHFHTRKLELGTCGRPYGTPCRHEHACIRCPSLRLDPAASSRLVEIARNLRDRITEARLNGWLGEVEGLQVSLNAAERKLVDLERTRMRQDGGPVVNLGLPLFATPL